MGSPTPRFPLSLAEAWRQPGSGLARASITLVFVWMGSWLLLGLWELLWPSLFQAMVIESTRALEVTLLLQVVCGVLVICCGVLARRTIRRAQRLSQLEVASEEQTEPDIDPQTRRLAEMTELVANATATSMPEEVALLSALLGGGMIAATVVTVLLMAKAISFEVVQVVIVAVLSVLFIWALVRLRRR